MNLLETDFLKPTCRVCLKNKQGKMTSIFGMDAECENLKIYEKIEYCAGIKIKCSLELPKFICSRCMKLLKTSYKFRTHCQNSEEYLNTILATKESQLGKKEESLEQNCLQIKEETVYDTSSCALSPLVEHVNEEPNSISCLPAEYQETFKEFYSDNENENGDVFIDIDYSDGEDILICGDNIEVAVKNTVLNRNDAINLNKKSKKRKKPQNVKRSKLNSAHLKTLETTVDGGAIIKEKKSRPKREDKQPHVCEICGNVYNRRHILENHIKRHSDVKDFECEICGNAFHSSFELGRHMRKHTGSKPYKCSYCPKAFGDHSTLTKHERVHRNERPFKCEICGSCFSYPGVLKRHKLVHTGEKPYKCEICGKCFNDRYHLQSHLKTIQHKGDPRVETLLQNIRENNV